MVRFIHKLEENIVALLLVAMTLLLGVYPSLVTDIIGPSTAALIENFNHSLAAADTSSATQVASH